MGRREAGIDQFCGRNGLDDGLTSASAKDEQNVPVLIREHPACEFSGPCSRTPAAFRPTPMCCSDRDVYDAAAIVRLTCSWIEGPAQMEAYDVCIVGAGVVGCAIARELGHKRRHSPLRIAVLEQRER